MIPGLSVACVTAVITMQPVFTVHYVCYEPGWDVHGNCIGEIEGDCGDIPIVTGEEEICTERYFSYDNVVLADRWIADPQGQPAGLYLQAIFREKKTERYELLPGQTLIIQVPCAYLISQYIEDYDEYICTYHLTLNKEP